MLNEVLNLLNSTQKRHCYDIIYSDFEAIALESRPLHIPSFSSSFEEVILI